MTRILLHICTALILLGLHACSEDIAEDGTKRGISPDGKWLYVFIGKQMPVRIRL